MSVLKDYKIKLRPLQSSSKLVSVDIEPLSARLGPLAYVRVKLSFKVEQSELALSDVMTTWSGYSSRLCV